jgi:hypothetical protein
VLKAGTSVLMKCLTVGTVEVLALPSSGHCGICEAGADTDQFVFPSPILSLDSERALPACWDVVSVLTLPPLSTQIWILSCPQTTRKYLLGIRYTRMRKISR